MGSLAQSKPGVQAQGTAMIGRGVFVLRRLQLSMLDACEFVGAGAGARAAGCWLRVLLAAVRSWAAVGFGFGGGGGGGSHCSCGLVPPRPPLSCWCSFCSSGCYATTAGSRMFGTSERAFGEARRRSRSKRTA